MIELFTYCILMYVLGGIGTSLGYHRILTHKSAELPKLLEYSIVLIGLPAGTPIQWVGNHRAHHKYTDKIGDPHSPQLDGFWYAHCGWYINSSNPFICFLYAVAGPIRMLIDSTLRPLTNQEHKHLAKDIEENKFYRNISKPFVYATLMWLYLFIVISIPYFLFGYQGVIAASLMLIFIYNIGDAVDSFGHLFGNKNGKSHARNNFILGILAFGDGWHANHHNKPKRAQHGIKKYQIDTSYTILKLGKLIGVVKKIY